MDVFKKRTGDRLAEHKKRAAKHGARLDFELADLRRLVAGAIREPCTYCRAPINAATFGIDHEQPIARGGTFELANLTVCCMNCNSAKGPLTAQEYRALLAALAGWPEPARLSTLARLRAGASAAGNYFNRPKPGTSPHRLKSGDGRRRQPPPLP